MTREQMIAFTLFVLRLSAEARAWGGLVGESTAIVDRWIAEHPETERKDT